jgi:hypothetical protein
MIQQVWSTMMMVLEINVHGTKKQCHVNQTKTKGHGYYHYKTFSFVVGISFPWIAPWNAPHCLTNHDMHVKCVPPFFGIQNASPVFFNGFKTTMI